MQLFKWLGLLLVFVVSALYGLFKSEELKKRSLILEELMKSLSRLGELIRMGGYEIDELIALCFDKRVIRIENGKLYTANEHLSKGDMSLLNDFLKGFGMADRDAEYERTKLFSSLLEQQYLTAVKLYAEKGRLYRSIGLMGGLILCIFLM